MKRYILAGILLFAVAAAMILYDPGTPQHQAENNTNDSYEYYYNENEDEEDSLLPEDLNSILADNQTVPLDTIPDSKTVLVNRVYLLPSTYIPANLVEPNVKFNFSYSADKRKMRKVAATALEKLFQAGEQNGIELYGISAYRSYARQKQIYDRNIATRGQAATDAVSAKPGSSEHQTGLTIDVSAKSVNFRLDQSFGDTKEGIWLSRNAHLYGFIIRYPYGKTKITGYSYEPWHIRFVGKTVATYLYENKLTLEEYYGVKNTLKNESDNRVDVEDPDSVKYATPKPTAKPTPTPTPSAAKKKKTKKKSNKPSNGSKQTAPPAAATSPPSSEHTAKPAATPVPPEPTPVPATHSPQPVPTPPADGSSSEPGVPQ